MAAKGHLAGQVLAWKQAEDVHSHGTHLHRIFGERLHDFSLLTPDIIKSLDDISYHFRKCHEQGSHEEMADPGT